LTISHHKISFFSIFLVFSLTLYLYFTKIFEKNQSNPPDGQLTIT